MSRDGQRRECPIIDNEIVPVQHEEGVILQYGGWIDTVHMFPESRLNHVKFYSENGQVSFQFLSEDILAALVERGIPLVIRESVFQREVDAHKSHCWAVAEVLGQVAVPAMNDAVEAEVQLALAGLDAELDQLLDE